MLNALEVAGLADDTLVIFTTDHGMPFPGAKATLYDRGLGVMLILRGPEPFHRGRVIDAIVSHIDVYPTICDFLGIARPAFLQGVSLLPLVRGEVARVREEIFAGSTWHAAYEPQRAIRTTRFKYIRRWGDRRTPVLPNTDDGPSKELLLRNGWADSEIPPEQLFDLLHDPNEAHNLVGDPAHADGPRRAARAAGDVDARDRRPAARRSRRSAAGRRDQHARPALGGRADDAHRVRLASARAAQVRSADARCGAPASARRAARDASGRP